MELNASLSPVPRADKNTAVELVNISKSYASAPDALALDQVTAEFSPGTFWAVMGPSGSGKSTLLQCAAGLTAPDSGQVFLAGQALHELREPHLTRVRRHRVGFVFQSYNLVDSLTVRQNVILPQRLAGRHINRAWISEILNRVGLGGRERDFPNRLSGGQQQRVAIARSLAARPEVIFADEPTGALDLATGRLILGLLRDAVDELGATVIMVTHDPAAASTADRVLFLVDGRVAEELVAPTPTSVADVMMSVSA